MTPEQIAQWADEAGATCEMLGDSDYATERGWYFAIEDDLGRNPNNCPALAAFAALVAAWERAQIIALLPGGDICDPQQIADAIRSRGGA